MKRLQTFLTENPSYVKCSKQRVANRLRLSIKTVNAFWKTTEFKTLKTNYFNAL